MSTVVTVPAVSRMYRVIVPLERTRLSSYQASSVQVPIVLAALQTCGVPPPFQYTQRPRPELSTSSRSMSRLLEPEDPPKKPVMCIRSAYLPYAELREMPGVRNQKRSVKSSAAANTRSVLGPNSSALPPSNHAA